MRDHVGEARIPLLGSPGNKLRIALGLSPSPPRSPSQQQHSPRAVSTTIFRTCAAIAGLVIINAILAGVILSAVHSFGGCAHFITLCCSFCLLQHFLVQGDHALSSRLKYPNGKVMR